MRPTLPVVQSRSFGCTRCGNCCRERGWVFFGLDEMKAMAKHLDLSIAVFRLRYAITWDRDERAWAIDATNGEGCPLLDETTGCTVHAVKPVQCKTFPFWDELLEDRAAWDAAKSYCPGIDNGRVYAAEEIHEIRSGARGT